MKRYLDNTRPRCKKGGKAPTNPGRPYDYAIRDAKDWHQKWSSARQSKFEDNLNEYRESKGQPKLEGLEGYETSKNAREQQLNNVKNATVYDLNVAGVSDQEVVPSVVDFLNKRNASFNENPNNNNSSIIHGVYDANTNSVGLANRKNYTSELMNTSKTTPIHELTHALTRNQRSPQLYVIKRILGDKYNNNYYDNPNEVMARLNEMRYRGGLINNPNVPVTINQINQWRNNPNIPNSKFLDRYDDETLLKLFNDVAVNNKSNTLRNINDRLLARNGKKYSLKFI